MREWIEAISGLFTSIGVVGTLVALVVGERRYRVQRQLERADQARLVLLEFTLDLEALGETGGYYVIGSVENLSERPIFEVKIELPTTSNLALDWPYGDADENTGTARAINAGAKMAACYAPRGGKVDWDGLNGALVRYTDANGARWTRTEDGEPVAHDK